MAETLCQLKKKDGGRLSETSIWTNPTPNTSFGGQELTMSSNYDNFDFIKVRFKISTNNSEEASVAIDVEDIPKMLNTSLIRGSISTYDGSSYTYFRVFYFKNDKSKIQISQAARFNSVGTNDTFLIPLEIIGLKY